MPQSHSNVLVHLIFSTKNRDPTISRDLLPQLWGYTVGILDKLHCPSLRTGGHIDHMHLLFSLSRTTTIATVVEEVKKGSSKWMKTQGSLQFAWQAGYAAFSVSESQKVSVMRYIEGQEEHHKRRSFQDEVRTFLTRHGIAYDELYLWD